MRYVSVVLLLALPAGCPAGFLAAGAAGTPSATLGPLRFVRPAVIGEVPVKMVQAKGASAAVSVGDGVAAFMPGSLPAGSHMAVFWAGKELGEGQAGPDGSLVLEGLPRSLNSAWVLWSGQPVPDLGFEQYGASGTDGGWGSCYGFSGRFMALSTFEQHSGYADAHVRAWDGSKWASVWRSGYYNESLKGLADDGARVLFVDYHATSGYRVLAYVPGSGVSEAVPRESYSKIEQLFRGADGRVYVLVANSIYPRKSGVRRVDGSLLVKVAEPLSYGLQYVVTASGEVFGMQRRPTSPYTYYVTRWSGTTWVAASSPFDGGNAAIVLRTGPRALWAVSNGAVCRLEDGFWSQPEFPCGVPAQSLYPMPDGSCWALVENVGTLQLAQWTEGTGWVLGPLMPRGAQWILGDDPDGNLWVGGPGSTPVPVYRLPIGLLR